MGSFRANSPGVSIGNWPGRIGVTRPSRISLVTGLFCIPRRFKSAWVLTTFMGVHFGALLAKLVTNIKIPHLVTGGLASVELLPARGTDWSLLFRRAALGTFHATARPGTRKTSGKRAAPSATGREVTHYQSLSKYWVTNARVMASPRPESRRMFSIDIAEKSVGYGITSSRSTQLAGLSRTRWSIWPRAA